MSDQQEKVALSETQRAFVTPIIGGIAGAGVAYGLPAALEKVREVRVKRNRDEYVKAMKDVHPDLKGIAKKDLHIAYNSLAMHSPHVLRDPLLGGQELLRMSKYRQADVNSLNEINKLRGNSMMDQALMNATNMAASGLTEGFKGYQAQRQADQDQAYRARMDGRRFQMDTDRMNLEQQKFDYSQQRDSDRDAYQKDRDATLDARDTMRDARALQTERSRRKMDNKRFKVQQNETRLRRQAQDVSNHYSALRNDRDTEKHDAWRDAGSPVAPTYAPGKPPALNLTRRPSRGRKFAVKSSSYNLGINEIVARLRDRNL